MDCLLALAVGTGEAVRARYMCVIGTTGDDCHTWCFVYLLCQNYSQA